MDRLIPASTVGLPGCVVGSTAVDVGVDVLKVPFKVGKGIYDAVKDGELNEKREITQRGWP
ncbi:hypothetical protein [Zoogloea sp.]|uniref:hypothetical protein n=1 Tax=Zoogloea sp. TaxID=49181 RepID=UPI001DC93AA2|nr:hypothetical protein [Zoogloea sp.]MBK6654534.1 hypothetical protein [Zoogloea sp.]MBK7846692.1 hypothetical protein [Zoogloea sp.]